MAFSLSLCHVERVRSRTEIVERLIDSGLIAIIRVNRSEVVLPICEALVAGGFVVVEVTLTTPNALGAIRSARAKLPASALVGAGSVLNADDCRAAIEAGAEFVVSPICKKEIITTAHAQERPVMMGAYTPTEAQLAHEAGADFIKIFPADTLGPSYIKNILAPLPHLRIVPTGGVNLQTAPEFLKAGCVALGVGSSLISAEIIRTADWPALTRLAGQFMDVVRASRQR